MKFIILHGDNSNDSYKRLSTFAGVAKKRGWEIVRISAKDQNLTEALVTESLFSYDRLFIVNDVMSINKRLIEWLKKNYDNYNSTIIFYHPNTLSKTFLNNFPKGTKIEEFKLPKLIWDFLDSFYPGNLKMSLLLLHKIIENEPIEFVFSLLASQLRNIYWVKIDPKSMNLPPWRMGKLKRQASRYSQEKIEKLISDLAEADITSKTSNQNLGDLLDFIIIDNLE